MTRDDLIELFDGVADAIADLESSAPEIAAACRAHAPSMYRLLRAMAALGLVEQTQQQHFRLTAAGQPLRKDAPNRLRKA